MNVFGEAKRLIIICCFQNVKSGFCGPGTLPASHFHRQEWKILPEKSQPTAKFKEGVITARSFRHHRNRPHRTMNPRFLTLNSLARLAFALTCATFPCNANAQVVTEFDTSTGGFLITCDPTQLPAFCAFDETYSRYIHLLDPDIDLSFPGVVKFTRPIDIFGAEDCREESCRFYCDDVCSCETGTMASPGGGFQPDGGSCTVLSSNPGTVPTAQPTAMPTAAPTFDMDTSVMYNATDMVESKNQALRVNCGGDWPVEDSYCKEVSGRLSYTLQNPSTGTHGWTNCNQNGDDCVVACSPDCTCEVAALTDGGGYDDTVPTTPCEVVEPTPAPTGMPTTSPTSGSAGSHVSVWTFAGLAIAYVVDWMV